ncbi:MAG TPA: triose-phosphate isomerase [bacterium]|nr:triose-phosphate isomerase [bacterium]
MRKPLVVGNWKMNGTLEETLKLLTELKHKLPANGACDVAVSPPFTALYTAQVALHETMLLLAGQNMHWETDGAFTGEVSGTFLKDVGCSFVLLGHSERRRLFGETDEGVNKKALAALALELTPIICVGETWEQREAGKTEAVLEAQIKKGLSGIPMNDLGGLVVAYEPVWAIGTGKTAKPDDVASALHFIRNLVAKAYDAPTSSALRVLYGGSVTPETAKELAGVKDLDGFLVGGASLSSDKFLKIIAAWEN